MATVTQIQARQSPYELPRWYSATWQDYIAWVDDTVETAEAEYFRIFFHHRRLFIDMGWEDVDHARFRALLAMLFFAWFSRRQLGQAFDCLGGCILEKPQQLAASPDEVLYVGAGAPRWQPGEPRRVNLRHWRVPDLICEVGDTTLATDLDEKKQIYAALEIPEYWAIDVRAARIVAFRLSPEGLYQQVSVSGALAGLEIALVEQAFGRLAAESNGTAAQWFARQLDMDSTS
ncbi:MAG: Uma2 family endonuclease [Coleofasciculaceae cyanobacterium SM2_3_26]|nr:Uma2 family endonuclease [Coleofasciculaceae cyanobacterium SM2_3_26]